MISSKSNPKIAHIRDLLNQRKTRVESREFVVEGVRLCEEAEATGARPRLVLFTPLVSERGRLLADRFREVGCESEEIPEHLMAYLSDTDNSQGILTILPFPSLAHPKERTFTVIADGIRDPGNLGTLMRSAAAAGVDELIVTPGTVDPFSPKVVRSGMGAHFHLPIREQNWAAIQEDYSAEPESSPLILLADMRGNPMWETNLTRSLALIIGGEAEGASEGARKLATARISIPMPGKSESLNAAVAGSILIFEVIRQRRR